MKRILLAIVALMLVGTGIEVKAMKGLRKTVTPSVVAPKTTETPVAKEEQVVQAPAKTAEVKPLNEATIKSYILEIIQSKPKKDALVYVQNLNTFVSDTARSKEITDLPSVVAEVKSETVKTSPTLTAAGYKGPSVVELIASAKKADQDWLITPLRKQAVKAGATQEQLAEFDSLIANIKQAAPLSVKELPQVPVKGEKRVLTDQEVLAITTAAEVKENFDQAYKVLMAFYDKNKDVRLTEILKIKKTLENYFGVNKPEEPAKVATEEIKPLAKRDFTIPERQQIIAEAKTKTDLDQVYKVLDDFLEGHKGIIEENDASELRDSLKILFDERKEEEAKINTEVRSKPLPSIFTETSLKSKQ